MSEFIEENQHTIDALKLRKALIKWGKTHFRQFPWRATRDPYQILIAEFMLLRTQAPQVAPVFEKFINLYPAIDSITQDDEEGIRTILKPLGLNWRIDYVWQSIEEVKNWHGGKVPETKAELLKLPGVSQYIAGAVLCFAHGKPEALIDTNTVRVTGRLFGLEAKDSSRRSRKFRQLIEQLISPYRPREFNFALLDLAAQVCKKRTPPQCSICPLRDMCHSAFNDLSVLSANTQG